MLASSSLICRAQTSWRARLSFSAARQRARHRTRRAEPRIASVSPQSASRSSPYWRMVSRCGSECQARCLPRPQASGRPTGDQIHDVVALDGIAAADLLDGLECAAPREHGHTGEQTLFGRIQQVVGPVDRRAQVACRSIAPRRPPASTWNRRSRRRSESAGLNASPAQPPVRWPGARRRGAGRSRPRRGLVVGQREVGLDPSCPLDES